MSDTPRTDEEAKDGWSGNAAAVSVEFAQQLEREIESLKAQLDRYTRISESGISLGDSIDAALYISELEAQLAECRDKALEEAAQVCDERELSAERDSEPHEKYEASACAYAIRALKGTKP